MAYGQVNADVIGTSVAGSSLGAGNATVFKNRIINGDMRIDQRNAGASVIANNETYSLDRWKMVYSIGSKFTVQQNAGSVTPPSGFINYLGATSSSAYTVGATETFAIAQYIEGLNVADLGWGTANAKPVTISFWVRSSLTGTFGGSLRNNANDRSYPFTYTINSANTWEYETITVAGDTSGTWLTTNSTGIQVIFGLGSGTTRSGTAGAWAATNYTNATGATSVVGTAGATFYITGVQLEVGSSATGFEYRDYTTQLAMCQRYYQKSFDIGTAPVQNSGTFVGAIQYVVTLAGGNYTSTPVNLPVAMRTSPTVTFYSPGAASSNWWNRSLSAASGPSTTLFSQTGQNNFQIVNNPQVSGDTLTTTISIHYAATAEL